MSPKLRVKHLSLVKILVSNSTFDFTVFYRSPAKNKRNTRCERGIYTYRQTERKKMMRRGGEGNGGGRRENKQAAVITSGFLVTVNCCGRPMRLSPDTASSFGCQQGCTATSNDANMAYMDFSFSCRHITSREFTER